MATLREIRQSIGFNLDGIQHGAITVRRTTDASPDLSTIIDATVGRNDQAGRWLVGNGAGNLSGVIRLIINSTADRLTLAAPLPSLAPEGMDYEIWDKELSPHGVHNHIQQAIDEANHRTYVPLRRDDLFIGRYGRNVEIPEEFDYVREIHYAHPFLPGINTGTGIGWNLAGEGIGSPPTGSTWVLGHLGVHVLEVPQAGIAYSVPEPYPWTVGYSHIASVVYGLAADAGIAVTINGERYEANNLGPGWHYAIVPLRARTTDDIDTITIGATGSTSILLYRTSLIQEGAVRWRKARFTLPPGSRTAYLGMLYDDYVRLRVHGGKEIAPLVADEDELPINPAFIIKKATALSVVALGREDPDSTLFDTWSRQARADYLALPTSGNRIRVRE